MTNGGRRRVFRYFLALPLAAAGAGRGALAIADASGRRASEQMYALRGVRGLEFATKTKARGAHEVHFLWYLAPPLKPEVPFFVLTRAPFALCPFCNSHAHWLAHIV